MQHPQVVVNLYPFRATVTSQPSPSFDVAVENIDIGGPAMIRAAAKNHDHVTVIVDPSDYHALLRTLGEPGSPDALAFRKRMAWKAFQHTATYDATVAEWLWTQVGAYWLGLVITVPAELRSCCLVSIKGLYVLCLP